MALRRGSRGELVRGVQEMLNAIGARVPEDGDFRPLKVDGDFGGNTERAVSAFQQQHGLLVDGVVGSVTLARLEAEHLAVLRGQGSFGAEVLVPLEGRLKFERVPADAYKGGYTHLWLRSDVASRYSAVREAAQAKGALLTSSGGKRDLLTPVTTGRSATSFHYTGRALDLYLYSGMIDPNQDPYVVVREEPCRYRVYARCNPQQGDVVRLEQVITYRQRSGTLSVSGSFLDLTKLFAEQGFQPIRARPSFEAGGSEIGAEWWHFQDESGLIKGQSTFGAELLKVYSEQTLSSTPPWQYRAHVFGVNWS